MYNCIVDDLFRPDSLEQLSFESTTFYSSLGSKIVKKWHSILEHFTKRDCLVGRVAAYATVERDVLGPIL